MTGRALPAGRAFRVATALPLLMLLGACSLAPRTVLPAPPVPASWPSGAAYAAADAAPESASAATPVPTVTMADIFRDPRLQALIGQALANNRDLRIAAANLAAARAQVRVVRADQFPAIGVSGSATRTDSGGGSAGDGWSYRAQAGVTSFELDLFGRLASATAAQRDTALATGADARTVRIALIADLALAWATYAADRDLLAIARSTAANAEDSVRLTAARLHGGVAPRTELRQAEQLLETARGDLAEQQAALAQDLNALRLLAGAEVDPALLPAGIDEVADGLAALPAGTSSQVLLRRPDVVAAEYQLRAADADIGAARAALFPSISLTGLLGLASDSLSTLFDSGAFSASAGADAGWSIFHAGGKAAAVKVARARRDAAVAAYERAIQVAFREVADTLADQGTLSERLRAASAYTAATGDAARLTEATYRQGVASSLDNLDAQRSLYAARRAEIAVRLAVATNRITLYRVLGGDAPPAPDQE